jgi:hypothetical protein
MPRDFPHTLSVARGCQEMYVHRELDGGLGRVEGSERKSTK